MPLRLLSCAPLLVLLVWAAVVDLRERRIPNWLTFLLILGGIAQSFCPVRTVTPLQSLLGILAASAIPLVLFVIGAIGGGDVKLMAGVGAWLGPGAALAVFVLEKVLGLAIVLTQAVLQRRTRVLLRNSAVVAVNLLHLKDVGLEHARTTGQSCRSVDRPLPFAVPVLLATVAIVLRLAIAPR